MSEQEDQRAEIVHAAMRGAIGAMAMTGMRRFTVDTGLMRETPPDAIAKRRRPGGLLGRVPRKRRKAVVEVMHWTVGVAGGAMFGALPDGLRRQHWFGPVYGLGVLASFELGIAPVLGLKSATRPKPLEIAALAADHMVYGFVLSEMRRRPQD